METTHFSLTKLRIRRHSSSETTARCSQSGENAKPVIGPLATDQYDNGFVFWFVDFTDFLTPKKPIKLAGDAPLVCALLSGTSSGTNGASSFSRS